MFDSNKLLTKMYAGLTTTTTTTTDEGTSYLGNCIGRLRCSIRLWKSGSRLRNHPKLWFTLPISQNLRSGLGILGGFGPFWEVPIRRRVPRKALVEAIDLSGRQKTCLD